MTLSYLLAKLAPTRDQDEAVARLNPQRSNVQQCAHAILHIVAIEGGQVVMLDEKRYLYCHSITSERGRRLVDKSLPERVGVYGKGVTLGYIYADIMDTNNELRAAKLRAALEKATRT